MPARQTAVPEITRQVAALPGVHAVLSPTTPQFRRHDTALITVLPTAETNVPAGQSTVKTVRLALAHTPGFLGIAGDGRLDDRLQPRGLRQLPADAGLIALATFMLLARAFRSVLLALKAVVMNLASLAAAYGVMTGSGRTDTAPRPCGVSPRPARSPCGCRSWSSRSSSDCRWTTRCSSSPGCARVRPTGDTRAAVVEGSAAPAGWSPAPR